MNDDRITCTQCQHMRGGRCMNAKRAQLGVWASIELGELARIPQRCPGYQEKKQ